MCIRFKETDVRAMGRVAMGVIGMKIDQLDARSISAVSGYLSHRDLYDDTFCRDHHDLVIIIDSLDTNHVSSLFRDAVYGRVGAD